MINLEAKPLPKSTREWADTTLSSWNAMNTLLTTLSKEDVRKLIAHELATKQRLPILDRLITRYSKLESRENQAEMLRVLALSRKD